MAAKSTSIYLSIEAEISADHLIIADRKRGLDASRSSVINRTLIEAAANLKQIVARKNGNRTIGWDYYYGDHHVGYIDGVASKSQAEKALDAFVYEELSQ